MTARSHTRTRKNEKRRAWRRSVSKANRYAAIKAVEERRKRGYST